MEVALGQMSLGEIARSLAQMPEATRNQLLRLLQPSDAADLVDSLSDVQAAQLIGSVTPETAAAIVHEMPSNEQADLLGRLPQNRAEAIYSALDEGVAEQVRRLAEYPDDVAGGLMITEMLCYPQDWTTSRVIDDLRANADRYQDYQVQYAFVVDQAERLVGVLRLRDLLLSQGGQQLTRSMIKNPVSVADTADVWELRDLFDEHDFLGVPVVDGDRRLIGLITREAVEEALNQRSESDYLKTQGIVKEELRTMPTLLRARRRLSWLSINIGLNVMAASVIAVYQDTLSQVIALAVFLPIISDMSGCSGNQAIAVSMRELALGLARPADVLRVWLKEISIGVINGLALGVLIGLVAFLWKGNFFLGAVVGAALALNTMIAVSLGGTLPLFLKRMHIDPAIASGPMLTTVTDMCGFFIALSLAAAMLPLLT